MLRRFLPVVFSWAMVVPCVAEPHVVGRTDDSTPPPVAREFRGVWVATVENIDWPSKPGLPTERQKREMVAILNKCVELNINAVIFQIRTQADALYDSKLEPWSEFLTGKMGEPPAPYYDPLKFAVDEAHKRGLQLHVWFNPYRVRVPSAKSKAAPNHASVAHADSVRKYGRYQWFDPGDPASEDEFIAVLTDVVKRYDVDGVHIDDYFYPYQEKDKDGKIIPFPDDETYQQAVTRGEKLARDDWRRRNVNHLIQRMYEEVKKEKPWVLVGISPFGIWRPGNPPGIVGFDQYATLYADARKWEHEGWLDYLTPQLYWLVESKGQSYPKLLGWWSEQNVKRRHLWPGIFTSRISRAGNKSESKSAWSAEDIIRQIEVTRQTPGATGNVHFSMKALLKNSDGIADKLKKGLYAEPALVPETTWLGGEAPGKPIVGVHAVSSGIQLEMRMPRGDAPWQWLVRVRTSRGWEPFIFPGTETKKEIVLAKGGAASVVVLCGVSRLGKEGPAVSAQAGASE